MRVKGHPEGGNKPKGVVAEVRRNVTLQFVGEFVPTALLACAKGGTHLDLAHLVLEAHDGGAATGPARHHGAVHAVVREIAVR